MQHTIHCAVKTDQIHTYTNIRIQFLPTAENPCGNLHGFQAENQMRLLKKQ